MAKRSLLDHFSAGAPAAKKPKTIDESPSSPPPPNKAPANDPSDPPSPPQTTNHPTYPFPIPDLATSFTTSLEPLVCASGQPINDRPHLDLLYFHPFIPSPTAREYFHHLRNSLPFYRVKYKITRFGKEVEINTPRFTTVFGVDATSRWSDAPDGSPKKLLDTKSGAPVGPDGSGRGRYKRQPRPIPECLDYLRRITEAATGEAFNFCLVNYYADGNDSISYHSDDERFLGENPAIASFSLGARRDFLMKHKPADASNAAVATARSRGSKKDPDPSLKLALGSGDMVLMRGQTQGNWLHSIPKRKGAEADAGRINITFRKAMVIGGTENYYMYNVNDGPAYRWDGRAREMRNLKERG